VTLSANPAPWTWHKGGNRSVELAGKAAGIAIFDHPGNPGYPTSWFVVATEKQPFWYLNPALLQPKPIRLKKGESFTHHYRVLVHDGSPDAKALDREAKKSRLTVSSWKLGRAEVFPF